MPTTKKAIKSKKVPISQAPPKRPAQPSAIPRPIQTAKPSTSNARTRIPSGTKRVHPSSAQSQHQNGAEGSDDDSATNPHARKVPRTSPPRDTGSASAASSARSPRPNGAGLYSTGRRLPTPMMAAMHSAQPTEALTSQNHFASPARSARSRESSVKTEDAGEADQEDPVYMDVGGELAASGSGSANDDQDLDDEEFNPWIEEFTVPTQRGSPSPELRYQRSFTKLGQRKPTPRRILLPDEGDLSAMAKTVYYEHDEDQVEAPSPSPNSRRRAIRARERALETAILSPSQPVRFLDGLDAPEDDDDDDDDDEEINPNASGNRDGENLRDPVDAEASGYGYDPRGFQVLEEVTPDASMEDMDVSSSSSSLSQASTSAQLTQSSRTKTRVLATEPKEQPARHATPPPPPEDPSFDDDDGLLDDPADDSRVPIASGSNGVRRPSGPQLVIVAATPQKTRQPSEPMSQHSPTPHEGTLHPHADVSASFETTEEEEDEEEDDESLDPDVVTVKSGNPKAAAKAAAILRLHHSYIIDEEIGNRSQTGHAPSRQSHSARPQSRSRSRARSDHAGDITMPDLVDEFEVELSQNLPRHPRAPSPSKRKLSGSRLSIPERLQNDGRISPTGSTASSTGAGPSSNRSVSSESDPWTKEDWKNLERCFIQERKVVAQRMQLASSRDVDPKHVDVDLVVERFKGFLVASKQIRFGPDWDRRKLVTRATVLARGISKKSQGAGDMTAAIRGESRDAATPSTFGDEFDYDQSLSMSRQGSVIGSSAGTGLYPQVNPPTANHASNGKTRTVSASSSETGTATQESSASHANSTKNTVASRLLGYLSGGRASPTPPPGSDDSFKRPMPRAPSSLRSVADSSGSTPSPTGPDMVQIRRDGRTPLVEPLRRASTGPMKDPDVRVMREREARPSLRHREPPTALDSSPARSISIPPLNHVDAIDYVRSSYSPAAPRALRSVSSTSSVRDLVRGFEDLSQEGIQTERAGTPRSVGRDGAASPKPRWSGGSSGSDHKPTLGDESIESTSSADSPYLFSETSFASSNVREIVVPKRKAIPETAAPHKKRMSFLGQWAS